MRACVFHVWVCVCVLCVCVCKCVCGPSCGVPVLDVYVAADIHREHPESVSEPI